MLFKRHYPELDLARAAAISLVLFFHLNKVVFQLPAENHLARLFNWGFHDVDLFFVLSGFLIGGQIIEENLAGTFSLKRFYLKRFWRIFPPYFIALAVSVVVYSLEAGELSLRDPKNYKDLFVHMAYLQNYIRPVMHNGLYWSVAVEEQFYILIPLILFLLIGFTKRVLTILTVMLLLGVSVKFFLYDPSKEWWLSFYTPLHTRFDNLLFGVLASYIFIIYKDRIKGLSSIWKVSLLLIAAASLATSYFYGDFRPGYFNICWQFIFTGLGFAILILLMTSLSFNNRLSSSKAIKLIADFSYEMYLYHTMILVLTVKLVLLYFPSIVSNYLNFFLVFAVYYIMMFLITGLIYWLVDRPCMNYRRRLLNRPEA